MPKRLDKNIRDIKNYEKLYAVTQDGRVWSYPKMNGNGRRPGHWMKTYKQAGYIYVVLCKDSKYKTRLIHRLVAETFLLNPLNKTQVNHINGIKDDNKILNLEWCTPSENSKHAWKMGFFDKRKSLKGEQNPKSKMTNEEILRLRELSGVFTNRELAKMFGISKSTAHAITTFKNWNLPPRMDQVII